MARNRMIKHQFWTSETVSDCSPLARLLFIGLWNFCDDAGIHPASHKRLKMEVFPGDDISITQIKVLVTELISAGLVNEYEVEEKHYWQVTGWNEHQKIQRPTFSHPKPGNKPDNSNTTHRQVQEDSRNNHGKVEECSATIPPEEKGREKKLIKTGNRDKQLINAQTQIKPKSNSAFRDLKKEDLQDTTKLIAWHQQQTRNKSPVVNQTESTLLNIISAAERALEHGLNPVALFAHIVGKKLWGLITGVQEDRARHRLRKHRSPPAVQTRNDNLQLNLQALFAT